MVKAAIIGVAIVLAVGLWIYFSPFQVCLRMHDEKDKYAALNCARATNVVGIADLAPPPPRRYLW